MKVLDVGDTVIHLRFFPDGRRLLVGTVSQNRHVHFDVVPLSGGERVRLRLFGSDVSSWHDANYGSPTAIHPSGEWCYVAWGGHLSSFWSEDGSGRPIPTAVRANQVVLSPDGGRLLAAQVTLGGHQQLSALLVKPDGDSVVWEEVPSAAFRSVAGFLPDGERFVTLDAVVHIRAFASGEGQAAGRLRLVGTYHAQVSPDGRHLGAVGYKSMYLWDTATLAKPRRISQSQSFGNFVGFAFHPDGRTLAVIHGGPTLVKLYDVETLKLTAKFNWKVGELASVAFSPDGMLGAAGSRAGRIVLWDVDP
ncbi:MAG: WD40 repeat domain-containing protein [Gemmataceae bacterium]